MRRADLIRRCAGRLVSTKSGNVAVMAGLLLPVGVILAAFAVDQGALYTDRRDLQALSDIAAITAAQNMDRATEAATLVVGDNRSGGISISEAGSSYDPVGQDTDRIDLIVEKGRYTPKSNIAVAQRFQAGVQPFNAARVSMRKGGDLYFGKSLMETPLISATSIAHVPSEAAFSIGSRLASLNGGVVNDVLNKLLGTSLSLSVMDYEALANVNVSALDFISALATELDLEAGTYDDVLDSNASIGQIANAFASISGANQTAQLALEALGDKARNIEIPLRQLIDLGSVGRLGIGEKPQGLTVDTNVMDMLQATAALANRHHQVEIGSGLDVPGLINVSAKLAIGEPPQNSPFYAVGESGTTVRTAQTRLKVTVRVLGGTMSGQQEQLLGLLTSLLPVVLNIATVELPIYVELAHAEARLASVSCPTGRPDSLNVSIAARPGVASVYVGHVPDSQFTNFTSSPIPDFANLTTISLGGLNILAVTGRATLPIQNVSETTLTFNKVEVDAQTVKTVSTSTPLQSLTQGLLNNLEIRLSVLGTPLGLLTPSVAAVKNAIVGLLVPVAPTVDQLLYTVLSTVGVHIGEADIRIHGATCGRSVLVQ
jgi:uncharacterized membrane protein